MKRVLFLLITLAAFQSAYSQITITAADMPVDGDTLRYSFAAAATTTINPADSGAGMTWNYTLVPVGQAVDTYKSAFAVNPLYAITIGLTAYGYKVADASPIPIPIPGAPSIEQVYTFFEKKTGPDRYQAKAFAAAIAGIPTPINYTNPDVWYFFPLTYGNKDSANFKLNITIPTFGSIKQMGVRKTRVDGWGTITTPYYTTPVSCIRVKSIIQEIDSVQFGPLPALGIPRNTIEYKWLVNGDHYPALWVTSNMGPGGTETISSVRYRDRALPENAVHDVKKEVLQLKAYPNPSANGIVTIEVPAAWNKFTIEVFDMQSKLVEVVENSKELNIGNLPAGSYLARVTSGAATGYVQIMR